MRNDRLHTRADAEDRARRAWTARVAGATWEQAARVAGYAQPQNAIRACYAYFGTLPKVDREQERELWRQRLEHLWRQSIKDTTEQRPGAVRAGVAVAQRAAQLFGLDEPGRTEVSLAVRGDVELLHIIKAGGLPTTEERRRYGITTEDIKALRAEAGISNDDL